MQFRFLSHVAFQVRDYQNALDFYEKVMGMEVIKRAEDETEFQCGSATFYVENSPEGNTYLSFEVVDLDGAREELIHAGCEITQEVRLAEGRGIMVRDPFGMRFLLSQAKRQPGSNGG